MTDTTTMRILQPSPGLFAYYDGRIAGKRLHSDAPNWLDDGAYELGTASYAIVDGAEALVYDTHITLAHARFIRDHLEGLGVSVIRVALSHWHLDHVAGNEVFADCEILALGLTAEMLSRNRDAIAARDPPVAPLVMPTRTFADRLDLMVGSRRVELHHFAIHSADGAVLWLPDDQILLAGDTLEDTVTYMSEAEHAATHIRDLVRLGTWPIRRILPNHGDPDRIAAGGYDARLIEANRRYLERLTDPAGLAQAEAEDLKTFVAADTASGAILYCPAYETVHRRNLATLRGLAKAP